MDKIKNEKNPIEFIQCCSSNCLSVSSIPLSATHRLRSRTCSRTSRMDTFSWLCWRSSLAASWSDLHWDTQHCRLSAFLWRGCSCTLLVMLSVYIPAPRLQEVLPPYLQTQQHCQGFVFSGAKKRECVRCMYWCIDVLMYWRCVQSESNRGVCVCCLGEAGQYRCSWCCWRTLLHHPGTHLEHHPLFSGCRFFACNILSSERPLIIFWQVGARVRMSQLASILVIAGFNISYNSCLSIFHRPHEESHWETWNPTTVFLLNTNLYRSDIHTNTNSLLLFLSTWVPSTSVHHQTRALGEQVLSSQPLVWILALDNFQHFFCQISLFCTYLTFL